MMTSATTDSTTVEMNINKATETPVSELMVAGDAEAPNKDAEVANDKAAAEETVESSETVSIVFLKSTTSLLDNFGCRELSIQS